MRGVEHLFIPRSLLLFKKKVFNYIFFWYFSKCKMPSWKKKSSNYLFVYIKFTSIQGQSHPKLKIKSSKLNANPKKKKKKLSLDHLSQICDWHDALIICFMGKLKFLHFGIWVLLYYFAPLKNFWLLFTNFCWLCAWIF